MKKIILLLVWALFFLISTAFSATINEQIEPMMKERNWHEVYKILNSLPRPDLDPKSRELFFVVRKIRNFIDDHHRCMEQVPFSHIPPKDKLICFEQAIKFSWKNMPKELPFSRDFISYLNSMKDEIIQKRSGISENLQGAEKKMVATLKTKREMELQAKEEAFKRSEEAIKRQREAFEREKKIKEEQMEIARIERQKQEDHQRKYIEAQNKAFESYEYKVMETGCPICECIEGKKTAEAKIAQEKSYSSKYGTVNLTKIDGYKQKIIYYDELIAEKKKEYKDLTKKPFQLSLCKKINLPCEDALDNLKDSLIKQYLQAEN